MKRRLLPAMLLLAACGDSMSSGNQYVARIVLVAPDSLLAVTDSAQLYVTAYGVYGQVLDPQDGSENFATATFVAVPAGIVAIAGTRVVGVGQGTARVIALIEGKKDTITVIVRGFAHRVNLTSGETWRARDNPHYVRSLLHVGAPSAVTLTLEPGAQLRFSVAAGLVFDAPGAVLRAVGTPLSPIVLAADSTEVGDGNGVKGLWSGILVSNSESELRNVVMSDCGRDTYLQIPDYFGACLALAGLFGDRPRPVIENLTIKDYGVTAVVAQGGAGFGAGSTGLRITGGGPYGFGAGTGTPFVITPNEVGTIPAGTVLSGNLSQRILLNVASSVSDSVVRETQTWPALAPYSVYTSVLVGGPSAPVLTLAPGVELQFERGTGLYVGYDATGGLVARGASSTPVVFTSPSAGKFGFSWNGIVVGPNALATSVLDGVVVEAGGGFNASFEWNGEIVVMQNGLDGLIVNSTIRSSGACGILRAWAPAGTSTDYTAAAHNNTFSDNRAGDQCGP